MGRGRRGREEGRRRRRSRATLAPCAPAREGARPHGAALAGCRRRHVVKRIICIQRPNFRIHRTILKICRPSPKIRRSILMIYAFGPTTYHCHGVLPMHAQAYRQPCRDLEQKPL